MICNSSIFHEFVCLFFIFNIIYYTIFISFISSQIHRKLEVEKKAEEERKRRETEVSRNAIIMI